MNIGNSNQVIFKEIQSVRSQWIWGLVLIPIVVFFVWDDTTVNF
jgi:hypothetical protein